MLSFIGKLRPHKESTDAPKAAQRHRAFKGDIQSVAADNDPFHDRVKGDMFPPEASYFSVRLVEMGLASSGNVVGKFLPICSCFLRYTYGHAKKELPFVVGYEMIKGYLADASEAGGHNVEFENVYVARDVPVKADGLVMYTALCRVTDSGFARGMLDLLAGAAETIGGAAAGHLARTGVDMTQRLAGLLGAKGVMTRFGLYDGSALRKSGYRIFAGAGAETLKASELSIDDGRFVVNGPGGVATPIEGVDYVVIALEQRATLLDDAFGARSHLPFHARWDEVKTKLVREDTQGAGAVLKELQVDVATSPDLTETDRLGMMSAYLAQVEKWRNPAGVALRDAHQQSIGTRLFDVSKNLKGVKPEVATVLECASNSLVASGNSGAGHESLEEQALVQTARAVIAGVKPRNGDDVALAGASKEMLSLALATTLQRD